MTKTERKQIVSVLTGVLAQLPDIIDKSGASPYICDNVMVAAGGHWDNKLYQTIKADISKRIGYKFSIESWLKDQSQEIAEQVWKDVNNNRGRKLQEYRKAWVRELIKEFSN